MEKNLLAAKTLIVAVGTAVGSFLGWKGIMALCWILVMGLDYLSGSAAACKEGKWSSSEARQGLWHKGGMILVVMVACVTDAVMTIIIGNIPVLNISWPGLIMPLVLAWYILTELGSILENAVRLGANVPGWLVKLLEIGLDAIDSAGDDTAIGGDKA